MEFFDSFPFTKLQGKNRGLDWVMQKLASYQKEIDKIPEYVAEAVESGGVSTKVETDKTLTAEDVAADAKATGDAIRSHSESRNPHGTTAEDVGALPAESLTEVSTAVGGVVLRKINNIVYISVPTGYAIIGSVTIPEGYRPSRDIAMLCIYHNTSYIMCEAVLTIGANGSITVKYGSGNIASDGWFCVTTCYNINQN